MTYKKGEHPEGKHAGGRPTMYNLKLAEEICEAISTSSKGLKHICNEHPHFPHHSKVWLWRIKHPQFGEMYAQAKANQAEFLVDEILEISDDSSRDKIINADGNERCDSEFVQRARLRVDTRKWIACKVLPRVYGDKIYNENNTTISVSNETRYRVGDILSKIEDK